MSRCKHEPVATLPQQFAPGWIAHAQVKWVCAKCDAKLMATFRTHPSSKETTRMHMIGRLGGALCSARPNYDLRLTGNADKVTCGNCQRLAANAAANTKAQGGGK